MAKRSSNGASGRRRGAARRDEPQWVRAMETLGRMIGSLQRELAGGANAAAKRRAKPPRDDAGDAPPTGRGKTGRKVS